MIPPFVAQELDRLYLQLESTELELLSRYLDLLLETNQKFNLTAVKDHETAWRRHIIDSLTLLPLLTDIPSGTKVIDVGSGGGLPGIPLAITRSDFHITLLEATAKKARFLEQCTQQLPLLNTYVINSRAEDAAHQKGHREKYDLAVCRALGPMNELLEYLLPFLRVGGTLLAMKGPSVEKELPAASDAMMLLGAGEIQILPAYPPGHLLDAVIIRVTKDRPTPKTYPRAPGIPHQTPL